MSEQRGLSERVGVVVWRCDMAIASRVPGAMFLDSDHGGGQPGDEPGEWFPAVVAARLVDVDSREVREALEDMWVDDEQTDEIVDEILYRLRKLRSPEPRDGES